MASSRRVRRLVLAAMTLALLAVPVTGRASPAPEPNLSALVETCEASVGVVPEAGPRGCRTVEEIEWGLGTGCRRLVGMPEECSRLDGRLVSEAQVAAYESSWVHRALGLQRGLDDGSPLTESLFLHTHNSFNSAAYAPTLSGLDPNQVYSMSDQLRMDVRALEIDVHWAPSLEGDPAHGMRAPIMCHGEPVAAGPAVVHAGCTLERHLREGLVEVRAWLNQPANQHEFLLLYLENGLDDDPAAHDAAAAVIEQELGDLVARPPAGQPCAPVPLTMSRREMLDVGDRVLIVGNCGPGAWGTWVHDRAVGTHWVESGSDTGDDYPDYPACEGRRIEDGYGERLIRHWEDSTWLSAMAGAGGDLTATEARRMARCGVNLIGFDQLHPDDPRLAAVVWSWAPDEPAIAGPACAYQGGDARFRSSDCGESRHYACADDVGWHVTATVGAWAGGPAACAAEFPGSAFSVPANGYRNEKLAEARAGAGAAEVWLAYADAGDGWLPA